ncbi:tripartite motif-containing protein 2-like isoform X2 [Bombyx mandarina]|nr:tripartite motif-containing protein 2 isoform X2 [Bombyx mori]XP_012550998.1 tripartite motif-containing protein 2 isoform X2 [Bombyx mori]XP_028042999.1 tripartite motif-containing protein 2-like isoform X2 [Bombyx mandarina]XP_028043000.1 tripartite motif-containing protein 2-like isoform X2 [Bombyx mandarina]XP_028043001.1 tripartite motif-containing protein 2-like isoform X2 [Bombyx mandarina]
MASMSSTLVETVSINYEDFNESFLTCGTCLCTYDGGEHTPKLLPCSHTVCLHCLTRIAASQTRDAGSFRCPICRELITIPRGGVPALPPSFLVNQLLDLMARQRREVIPQCSSHPGRELLFCETCDCVFCRYCADGPHSDTPCDHTVVPFSIALKRMSEILLYRANECLSKLGSAREAVAGELRRLEAAATAADEAIDRHFAELRAALEKRHNELKSAAAAAASHKRKLLEEQLKLIDAEKSKVEAECSGLQQQVEVREVSSRAAALGARLGDAAALAEPRENAFLAVDFAHNDAQQRFVDSLEVLGRVRTSTTFPGLCSLQLESSCVSGLEVVVVLRTVDYHGEARSTGGDPVTAAATLDDAPLPCTVTDLDSGLYRISMRPWSAGSVSVRVLVFSRAVRDSPLRAAVTSQAAPLRVWGARGNGKDQLSQPVALARCPKRKEIYVLDAGNSRVKVLDDETFAFKTHIVNEGLAGRSCTGIAVTAEGVAAVNWRTRTITEVNTEGTTLRTIRSDRLVEPVCVAADVATRRLAVADNGARTVFVFDRYGNIEREIGNGDLGLVGGLALSEDLIIIADVAVRIYDSEGNLKNTLAPVPKGRGVYGGVAIDETGSGKHIVCARSVRGRAALVVLEAGGGGKTLAACELLDKKPRRVAGIALLPNKKVLLADLAGDCLRLHTYW